LTAILKEQQEQPPIDTTTIAAQVVAHLHDPLTSLLEQRREQHNDNQQEQPVQDPQVVADQVVGRLQGLLQEILQ